MRLESFCRFAMRYLDASWHRPYDHVGEDGEAIGFGHGDGSVIGEIEGTFVWANYPRRRQDGVWTPNLRGKIALQGGGEVLVAIHGQSVQETGPTPRRAILARAELTTEASPYRYVILDRDSKFDAEVISFLKATGLKPKRTSIQSPWQNGTAERWVGGCRKELLDFVIPLNAEHLRRLMREYIGYFEYAS